MIFWWTVLFISTKPSVLKNVHHYYQFRRLLCKEKLFLWTSVKFNDRKRMLDEIIIVVWLRLIEKFFINNKVICVQQWCDSWSLMRFRWNYLFYESIESLGATITSCLRLIYFRNQAKRHRQSIIHRQFNKIYCTHSWYNKLFLPFFKWPVFPFKYLLLILDSHVL